MTVRYKQLYIDYYRGRYSVQFEGDDLYFTNMLDAQAFIDEVSV